MASEGIKKSGEITVCFVDNKRIRKFNSIYLGQDSPTDVIAFNISESKSEFFADILISTDMASRNARVFKTTPPYEICLYVIHGLLHILGYDHKSIRQKKIMDEKASRILSESLKH